MTDELNTITNTNDKEIFLEIYKISESELEENKHFFRYLCFKYINLIKKIEIPVFQKDNKKESVLIEYRLFPHVDFLIRNTILKLDNSWSHTVICGNLNYEFMKQMCNEISINIKVIKTNFDNLTLSEYNKFLTSVDFWNLLVGEKILIYQEDSIIFNNNINNFMSFDFIGAHFPKSHKDPPNSVGSGGLSLRTKRIMLEIISKIKIEQTIPNSETFFPPEHIYFSKNMQDLKIGKVADFNSAFLFSSSENVNNPNSLGGHQFWLSDIEWKKKIVKFVTRKEYNFNNDIIKYLKFVNLSEDNDKTKTKSNAFDVDLYFCNLVNNLQHKDLDNVLSYIKNVALKGFIYHPKQIVNIYPNLKFYYVFNNIFIKYNKKTYKASYFVNFFLYKQTFNELSEKIMTKKYDNLNREITLLLLVFIGNKEIGIDLINRILEYKKIQKINVSFCFNSVEMSNNFKDIIKKNFEYYSIYISKNLGTDITSTLLMYYDISKKYKFSHIIKLHTKSIKDSYMNLTNFILSMPLNKLILHKKNNCNCIGNKIYYMALKDDVFNLLLIKEHEQKLNMNYDFVAGTIFYCSTIVFEKVIKFMENNNYKSYLLNNLYENNSINKNYSPIHFLERVFGVIKL